jgi:hypothetical protein
MAFLDSRSGYTKPGPLPWDNHLDINDEDKTKVDFAVDRTLFALGKMVMPVG